MRAHVAHLRGVLQPLLQVPRARTVPDRAQELLADVRARIARDRDVVEVGRGEPRVVEAPLRGEIREARTVLDAIEALLLGGGDELAVDYERRGGVAVEGVEAEDRGHAIKRLRAFSP